MVATKEAVAKKKEPTGKYKVIVIQARGHRDPNPPLYEHIPLEDAMTRAYLFARRHKTNVHVVDEVSNKPVFKVLGNALPN